MKVNHTTYVSKREKYGEHDSYVIAIRGKTNLKIWFDNIGSNNPVHITKYEIWKKFGFCPPRTTLEERRKILKGEISPYSYYKDL